MQPKVFSRSALVKILNRYRGKKRIVFTNGCFDILHAGHLRLLTKAKRSGDILVVALNSDSSVRKIKGPKRPLVDEKKRAQLLAALSCVDYVTFFSEETPAEIISELHPDVLVKGGDWKRGAIVGRDKVKRVLRVPLVKNLSTTTLIEKILRVYGRKKKA